MIRVVLASLLMSSACSPMEQPKSAATVAPYKVSLPTSYKKLRFVDLLSEKSQALGFHVDAIAAEPVGSEN